MWSGHISETLPAQPTCFHAVFDGQQQVGNVPTPVWGIAGLCAGLKFRAIVAVQRPRQATTSYHAKDGSRAGCSHAPIRWRKGRI
jgi:hypothetical protein